jgi:tRNA G18 (ribose-2'-O)-methylase SpoU
MKTNNRVQLISLDLPELQPYRTLRRPMDHINQGIFVAEGEKVVRRLLASDLRIVSMLVTPLWYEELLKDPFLKKHDDFIFYVAEKNLHESIVGYNLHQGIMAVGKLPNQQSLESLVEQIHRPHFLVALDGLVNAENVGVVVRNCAAFGVDALIVGETSSSPYLRRAVRNSMGTVFSLPVVHVDDLSASLMFLNQNYGTKIIGTALQNSSKIHDTCFSESICIVLGNEGDGISSSVIKTCSELITIPMMNRTDSLNVASASAVFLYEATKQRSGKK